MGAIVCNVKVTPGEVLYEDTLEHKATDRLDSDPLTRALVDRMSQWMFESESLFGHEDLKLLGTLLYKLLFRDGGSARSEFEATCKVFERQFAEDSSARLRLVLEFVSEAEA